MPGAVEDSSIIVVIDEETLVSEFVDVTALEELVDETLLSEDTDPVYLLEISQDILLSEVADVTVTLIEGEGRGPQGLPGIDGIDGIDGLNGVGAPEVFVQTTEPTADPPWAWLEIGNPVGGWTLWIAD